MKVLLLGRTSRTDRKRGGGISRSAYLIEEALTSMGDEVELSNLRTPLETIPPETDLVWFYGEFDTVKEKIQVARRHGVPILVNSTYDGTSDRANWLVTQLRHEWDPQGRGDVFLAVFSETARDNLHLKTIRRRLVVVPKTIRSANVCPTFDQRTGICLGELVKARRPRLIRGIDFEACVEELRKAVPEADLWLYGQYGNDDPPAGVRVQERLRHGFLEWLSAMRIFVSVAKHETFYMVPVEAQSVGTPVIYRHMPQSLSSCIGHTGLVFETPQELAVAAKLLYRNQEAWRMVSGSSRLNAMSKSAELVGPALHFALQKMLLRVRPCSK